MISLLSNPSGKANQELQIDNGKCNVYDFYNSLLSGNGDRRVFEPPS